MSNTSSRKRVTITCPRCGAFSKGPTQGMINRVQSSGIFFARDKIEVTCGSCGYK